MNEDIPSKLVTLKTIIKGETPVTYSDSVQHYGWCGYRYTLAKILTDYIQIGHQSALDQEVTADIQSMVERMDSGDSAVDSLDKILPAIESIITRLHLSLLAIPSTKKDQANKLRTLISALEDVPVLIEEEAAREKVREQQRLLAEEEHTHRIDVDLAIANYTHKHLRKDETLSTRYDETIDEDIVVLTILVADDIIRRKIRVVPTTFIGNIDNIQIFCRKDFTVLTIQEIFHAMRASIKTLVTSE